MGDLEWPAPSTKAGTTNDIRAKEPRGCLCPPSPSSFPQKMKKTHNNIKEVSIIQKLVLFPIFWKRNKTLLSFALAVWGFWMKFPDGTWSANLFFPEEVPGGTECFVPRVAEQGHTCLWHLWLGQPVPPALCSFQTQPSCLWTSSHFQATDSMCYLQGIVSKIPPNLEWGGRFPSAIPTLGTAAPEAQAEWAISKLVALSKNQRCTWGQIPGRWRSWKKDPTELVCAWILF